MCVRNTALSFGTEMPHCWRCWRNSGRVEAGPGSMSAEKSSQRSNALAMERGRPCQFRSMTVVESTEEISLAKAAGSLRILKAIFASPRAPGSGPGGALRKYLQNDELIEYAL